MTGSPCPRADRGHAREELARLLLSVLFVLFVGGLSALLAWLAGG